MFYCGLVFLAELFLHVLIFSLAVNRISGGQAQVGTAKDLKSFFPDHMLSIRVDPSCFEVVLPVTQGIFYG